MQTKKTVSKKRKYTPKKTFKGITQKYAAKPKTREIKTVDLSFTANYQDAYVAESFTGIVFNTNPLIQNLVTVRQGAGIPNRIGNKIALKSLRVRASVQVNANATSPNNQILRWLIVYDRQPNGAYPVVDNLLSDITVGNTIVAGDYQSSINPSFYDRFIVLCDKLLVGADIASTLITGPTEQKGYQIDEFIKLKGLETVFQASTTGSPIADINTGALYLVTWGNIQPRDEPLFMSSKMRLRFYDN